MTKYKKVLEHFALVDPKIRAVMETLNFDDWLKPHKNGRDKNHFQALCRTIIGQQLSGKAAGTIYSRFENLFGGKEITPERVLNFSDQELRSVGLSWAKAKYVRDLAQKTLGKEVLLDKLEELPDAEVVTKLTKIKGIGSWTAEMFLLFTLDRENIFSFGDLGLKNGFTKVYEIKAPTPKQLERVVKKWEPYKSFGTIALWYSLEN